MSSCLFLKSYYIKFIQILGIVKKSEMSSKSLTNCSNFAALSWIKFSCGASDPCLNGGTCRDGEQSFTCECPTGFTGTTCESLDACASSPCFSGATCINHPGYQYTCACSPQYTGLHCESHDACGSLPCLNGGTCVDDGKGSHWCLCDINMSGDNCEIVL